MTDSYVIWLIHTCEKTHSYHHSTIRDVWHDVYDSFIRDTTHDFTTWLNYVYDMTHSNVTWLRKHVTRLMILRHDSFICMYVMTYTSATWLIHEGIENELCMIWMRRVTYECMAWLIHMWHDSWFYDMTHFTTWLIYMCVWYMTDSSATWLINENAGNESSMTWMSRVIYEWVVSHMNEACPIWISSCPTWTSHVTWMSRVIYEWVVSQMIESCMVWLIQTRNDSLGNVTWLHRKRNLTPLQHDSLIRDM